MSQASGVLIIGPSGRKDFGAHIVSDFQEAKSYLETHQPSVLVFGHAPEFDGFCEHVEKRAPQSLWLLATDGLSPSQIRRWNNTGRLHDMIDGFEDPELENKLRSALEASGENVQTQQLVGLIEDQSQTLKRLTNELEARVTKRHKTLRKSLKTLEQTKTRLESFHKALLGIHRAGTMLQMEQSLNEALGASMDILWVRVRFESSTSPAERLGANVLTVEIPLTAAGSARGRVLFAKPEGKRFNPEEVDFLHELTEALALALSRLHKLEQAETLKGQWQATFDSIPHALCLTTGDFEILKLNSAFQRSAGHGFRDLIGKNCFKVFFGDEFHPPPAMQSPFTFRNARTGVTETEQFEVVGERLGMTHDNQSVHLILLRDITSEVRLERRIVSASKLAELGTIGSSIAHELNNPLGGMLSFLQLILMDMKATDAIQPEVKGMEQAVLRCRDIVQNLLSFARKQDLGEFTDVDLHEIIDRAVKLIELQSKSKGIEIDWHHPAEPVKVHASANALSQALCNLLQNSIDAISERLKADPLFPGKILVVLDKTGPKYQLRLSDNGLGIRPEHQSQIFNPLFTTRDPSLYNGMGLTTAFTIVSEHGGTLEILSQTGSGTTAIVTLDLSLESRLFDGQI